MQYHTPITFTLRSRGINTTVNIVGLQLHYYIVVEKEKHKLGQIEQLYTHGMVGLYCRVPHFPLSRITCNAMQPFTQTPKNKISLNELLRDYCHKNATVQVRQKDTDTTKQRDEWQMIMQYKCGPICFIDSKKKNSFDILCCSPTIHIKKYQQRSKGKLKENLEERFVGEAEGISVVFQPWRHKKQKKWLEFCGCCCIHVDDRI